MRLHYPLEFSFGQVTDFSNFMLSIHELNMEILGALNQYMNICRDAFDGSAAKLNISFKSVIIETLPLFMVIPRKINFTQLERYGTRCEQCYRQTFTKEFDWIRYNMGLMNTLFDRQDRKSIAIDSSYISRSGKQAPWIGYFWSGCAGQAKRGLEILGVGAIDIDKLYFSTDINMSARDVIDFYRTRFQIEFCYRDAKQFTGLYHSQARDTRRLDFAFNAPFTAINVAKIMMKENSIPFSMEALKSLMFNSYLLDSSFKLSGVKPNKRINAKLVKELIDIAAYQAA